jgi:hypothetical protein
MEKFVKRKFFLVTNTLEYYNEKAEREEICKRMEINNADINTR